MRLWLRNQSLSLFFLLLFLVSLLAQSIAGQRAFNEEQLLHGSETVSYGRYVLSSEFGQAVFENWQSEYLQFMLFIMATVWFIQRGSNESKRPEDAGRESDARQQVGSHAKQNSPRWAKLGGWRTAIYSNSLLIVMSLIFFASWFGQSVTGWTKYNDEQLEHGESLVSWTSYVMRPDFWENTVQNWQSEFLAVGTMAVYTIYLRQRGSPESKPVGAPHDQTGTSG
jgi:hypothetical protein